MQIWQIRVSSSISTAQRPKRGELQHLSPFFLATFCHHSWCQVEKNSQQKKIKILDKYILLHSSGHHSRPCCSWKDSSLWQGEQHISVYDQLLQAESSLQYSTKYMELYPQGQLSACTQAILLKKSNRKSGQIYIKKQPCTLLVWLTEQTNPKDILCISQMKQKEAMGKVSAVAHVIHTCPKWVIYALKDCIAAPCMRRESHGWNSAPYWAFWENSQCLSKLQNNCLQQTQMMIYIH